MNYQDQMILQVYLWSKLFNTLLRKLKATAEACRGFFRCDFLLKNASKSIKLYSIFYLYQKNQDHFVNLHID